MSSAKKLRGPLADSYLGAVFLVVAALVPFLAVTAAIAPLTKLIGHDVGLSENALRLTIAMSDGAYAFGTVLAVQLAQHLPPRRMLIAYVVLFLASAVVAAWAPTRGLFIVAFVVEGLCTSLMLIGAVPPLVTAWGADKLPWTGTIMNLCIFGAVAAGPSIGSFEAGAKDWRTLFWVVAAIGVVALLLALLTFEDVEPQNTDAPWDIVAIVLAAAGCFSSFFGAAELEIHKHATTLGLATLFIGVALIVALIAYEFLIDDALIPVEQIATTFPAAGLAVAVFASAAAFGLMELTLTALKHASPSHVGVLFLPELGAAVLTAAIFGALFRTRVTPLYALAGILVLAASGGVLLGVSGGSDARIALGTGLLGLGVGAAVSPGLFIAGFSLPSSEIQRVFALIELLRGVGAFLFAPILLYLVGIFSTSMKTGLRDGVGLCIAVAAAGAVIGVAIFGSGGARLQRPDLERWQEEGEPAWESPPLLERLFR